VARRFPSDVHLVVAGARGSSTVFTEVTLDRIPDRVHFTGYVKQEHLPALYSGALALCYPSLYEGFGLPPVEAMACGTPVVTSASTSLPEVVGSAAVLVNAEEIDDIGEGMRRVVESADLRASLRKTGLAKAATYSWDTAAALTRGLLHQFA
jgi:glycosyltransferase involved in cell wall biosynthesis